MLLKKKAVPLSGDPPFPTLKHLLITRMLLTGKSRIHINNIRSIEWQYLHHILFIP